jgi:hypothetical protein
VNISQRLEDELQLRVLSHVLRDPNADITPRLRRTFADALDRHMADDYPARAKNRPRKDERNLWLAVDYLIRCKPKGSKKTAEAKALSEECSRHGIALSDDAIRKLPATHKRAARLALQLIKQASGFRDPHAAALDVACGQWMRAEALVD